jgi:hypothetical protein
MNYRAIAFLSILVVTLFACANKGVDTPGDTESMPLPEGNKTVDISRLVSQFANGVSRISVNVTLSPTAKANELHARSLKAKGMSGNTGSAVFYDMGDPSIREALRQTVSEKLDTFTKKLDPSAVDVTRKFTYVFGFTAQVTQKGLNALAHNPDVVSISKDQKLHAH